MEEVGTEERATQPAPVSELITAVCSGQLDRVVQLLDSRLATEDASLAGYSVVHYAAVNNRAEILHLLIRRGFNINSRDSLGYAPLHLASAQGHVDAVAVLLEALSSVNSQDHLHGNTAIHEAAWNGFSQTLQALIQHKADVNLLNKAGFSALHLSSQNGHNECSRILLFADCNPNCKNNYGDTALHTAARYGHAGVTRILLIAKCNINEQNQNGDTALHIAVALKFRKITKMLLQTGGCDTNIKNNQNERAVDIARRKGHGEILRLLTSNVSVPSQQSESFDLSLYKVVPVAAAETAADKSTAKQKRQKWSLFSKNKKTKEKPQPESAKPHPALAGIPLMLQSPSAQRSAPAHMLTARPGTGSGQTVSVDPDVVLRSFHLHQMQKHRALKQGTSADPIRSYRDPTYPVQGMLGQYSIHSEVQYYRDLAGNIKQGPVGYVSETTQMPRPRREFTYQPPDVSLPHIPARLPTGGPIQHQHDHLSYLRSRNAHLASGTPQVGQYAHLYEQPRHSDRYWADLTSRRFYTQQRFVQNLPPEMSAPIRMVRSRSDETISTASSCQPPPGHVERTRNVRGRETVLRRHRSRTRPVIGQLLKENPEYFASGNPDLEQENFDRHQRLVKKSQRSGQTSYLRKKTEKTASTSSDSGANSSQPLPPGKPLPPADAAQSRLDETSNPDSGYGGSKACLEGVTTSLQQLALSNSSSFRSSEDLQRNGSDNKLTSSTDNASVVSSAPSGSAVSLCNSL